VIQEKEDKHLWRLNYVTPDAARVFVGYVLAQTWFLARQAAEPLFRRSYKEAWPVVHADHDGNEAPFIINSVKVKQIEEAQVVEPQTPLHGAHTEVEKARAGSSEQAFRWLPSTRQWEPVALERRRKKR